MISHFCSHHETSDKAAYPTFARTRPPASHITKSVAALLLQYGWDRVALFHSAVGGSEFGAVAETMVDTLRGSGIEIR